MLSLVLAIALIQTPTQTQTPPPPPANAKEEIKRLINAMIARYSNAKSLQGTLHLTLKTEQQSGEATTYVAFKTPNLIRIVQNSPLFKSKFIKCDGKVVAYTIPEGSPTEALAEPAFKDGVGLLVRDMYHIGGPGLKDRNAAFDIIMGAPSDIRAALNQWASFNYQGSAQVGDRLVHTIQGDYRDGRDAPKSGTYELRLTDQGDIVSYAISVLVESKRVNGLSSGIHRVVSSWIVNVQVDPEIPDSFFTLR